ncbi:MAG: RimK family alpha-L-glutamate ligase [Christensenellales bacterium]
MTGYLIINRYFSTPKLREQYDMLIKAFSKKGVSLTPRFNDSFCIDVTGDEIKDKPDFVLMWDKDVFLAKALEGQGIRLFNNSKSIEICDDKATMHVVLGANNVPCPNTVIAPMTYPNIGYDNLEFVEQAGKRLGFPMIIKLSRSSYGMGVFLAKDLFEAQNIMSSVRETAILQHYEQDSFGTDVRVFVVGGKAICAVKRSNDNDFRSNVEQGGRMEHIRLDGEMAELAQAAANATGAEYAGVDLIYGKDGLLVCEVNTSAHFGTLYRVSAINMAEYIADYVTEQIYGM